MDKKREDTVLKKGILFIMLLAALGACSPKAERTGTEPRGEPLRLTWWSPMFRHVEETAGNFGEIPFYQELQRRTNTEIKFIHPQANQPQNDINMMIASGRMPDLIEGPVGDYATGPQQAIDDGIIVDLSHFVPEYSPNYQRVLEGHPEWGKQVKTDEGCLYTYGWFRGDESLQYWFGPQIRTDLLERAGLPLPETIAEWDAALRAFQKMGIEYPLTFRTPDVRNAFAGAYDVGNYFYLDDGELKLDVLQPKYRDYLLQMHRWYEDGLLDREYNFQDLKTLDAKVMAGKAGAYVEAVGGSMGQYIPALKKLDQSYSLAGTRFPVLTKGETAKFGMKDPEFQRVTSICITTACENPAGAAKMLDYGYSEEGHLFFNFGIEGESYRMEEGYPRYTEEITNSRDGTAMIYSMSRYMASAYGGPFVQDKRYFEQYLLYPEQQQAVERWSESKADPLPILSHTREETDILATRGKELEAFQQQNQVKFITGQRPLSEFEDYIEELKGKGIDEIIDIYRQAYGRLQSR